MAKPTTTELTIAFSTPTQFAVNFEGDSTEAIALQNADRPADAEAWYRQAIDAFHAAGNVANQSKTLNNLANLLRRQPDRLAEARQLAEEALQLRQTLDPAAAEIWNIYNILAKIADRQNDPEAARTYRRQARAAKANYAGTQYELQRRAKLILLTVMAVAEPERLPDLETELARYHEANGWGNLVAAIRQILAGERDEDRLLDPLDLEDSMIILAILRGIADPSSLAFLQPDP